MTMRIAVTGASGFVGRHVVSELAARGAQVVAASRHPVSPAHPAITPLALDVTHADAMISDCDALVHLAWGGLPNYRSTRHLEHELPRHISFLDACLDSGLRKLVVAGTCLEYGLQSGELDESMEAHPTTAYGQAKHALHQHLLQRSRHADFDLVWLRLFYVYGPGQAVTSLYASLRAAVESGATTFDMSPGDQVRDFLPIERAAADVATLTLKEGVEGTVNICSGKPATVTDTVNDWLDCWQAEIVLNRGVYTYPDYEPFSFWGSTKRLRHLAAIS